MKETSGALRARSPLLFRARSALIQVSQEDDSSDSEPEQVIHGCDELSSLHKFMQGCGCKKHCEKNFSLGQIQEHVLLCGNFVKKKRNIPL
ncbi:hypothetical protein DPMN_170374 [Dreissena polymorpha]|uniref:Uncharacterized protein n=1 Tax=Dreissena polymorpha TaxID=45954 RepID=A0A9D4DWW9_DREPO|nr:hypothetical protein DPMN_170374 [Dreissena polymorpha]